MMTVIWVVMAAPLRVSTPVCVVPFHFRVDVTIASVEALVMDAGTFQRQLRRIRRPAAVTQIRAEPGQPDPWRGPWVTRVRRATRTTNI